MQYSLGYQSQIDGSWRFAALFPSLVTPSTKRLDARARQKEKSHDHWNCKVQQNHILLHAETAVQEIRSGLDYRNVIIQCYSQMSAALQQESGIERSGNMTSREFGHLLISRGFPAEPVHELTRLFEKVRYGQEALVKGDETRALDSLAEIIRFAKGGSRA